MKYERLKNQIVPQKIHELIPGGVNACIEPSSGQYAKTWTHKIQLLSGPEKETTEMVKSVPILLEGSVESELLVNTVDGSCSVNLDLLNSTKRDRHRCLQFWCDHEAWHCIYIMWRVASTETCGTLTRAYKNVLE